MTREEIQEYSLSLKGTVQDIKWEVDLCYCIGEKMFSVHGMVEPYGVSFKVLPEEFDELTERPGIVPAPYLARYKWVLVKDINALSPDEWKKFVKQSYELVLAKLPKKKRLEILEP